MVEYPSGFILFAMSYENESDIEYAKEYCREQGYTPETASIYISTDLEKNEKYLLVKKK